MDLEQSHLIEKGVLFSKTPFEKSDLIETLYRFQWSDFFSHHFKKEVKGKEIKITFEHTNLETIKNFVKKNNKEIFSDRILNSPFTILSPSPFKDAFSSLCIDHFIFKVDGEDAGFFIGNLADWESYYLRYINLLPKYRSYQISMDFYRYFLEVLKTIGIAKVEAHLSSNNKPQINKLLELNFIPTGQQMTLRWGTVLSFSHYFNEDEDKKFQGQFFL